VFWHLRRTRFFLVLVTLLAVLVGGFLGDFVHTDDGCAFETHCLACQRNLGSVAVVTPDLAALPTLQPLDSTPTSPTFAIVAAVIRAEAPRGPPQV
jgi:hypothetical protein